MGVFLIFIDSFRVKWIISRKGNKENVQWNRNNCSRFGIFKTMMLVLILYILGVTLLLVNGSVYLALVFLAFGSGSIGTLMPVLVRTIFGSYIPALVVMPILLGGLKK